MKYNINYIDRYLYKVESEQDYQSKLTWLIDGEPSKFSDQIENWIKKLNDSKAVFDKDIRMKEFIKTKGYTNSERLEAFPQIINLLHDVYLAGYSVGENEVYKNMNLKIPNDCFHYDFQSYMDTAWDVEDNVLKILYKTEIDKL
jgi:hypothetical protein